MSFHTSQDLKTWIKEVTHRGDAYTHSSWPVDLWNRSYTDIIEFLKERFEKTTDMQEYYNCMMYLSQDVEPDTLFVLWKNSPNFKALKSVENSEIDGVGTNTLPPERTHIVSHSNQYEGQIDYLQWGF
ncbi:hypothetical protein [uncultured Methanomethylovorans sp.]|uniref:hypothetical protein n=1 Tax=uncultured Methanomethylovorans sp. TaxID=183759 RepID=UPI002AA8304C|nr:hypothetical protein [uncultured Methanomethylovorans sp.]